MNKKEKLKKDLYVLDADVLLENLKKIEQLKGSIEFGVRDLVELFKVDEYETISYRKVARNLKALKEAGIIIGDRASYQIVEPNFFG